MQNTSLQNKAIYAFNGKYAEVGSFLRGQSGSILDLGARDCILKDSLDIASFDYKSCDIVPGHDYAFNLEEPIPLPDRSFDYVAALDVLEHLENIHDGFAEMMRITDKYLFIVLPNMSSVGFRFKFVFEGKLNGKYWLLPEHQGDRHRWLTVFPEIYQFVDACAAMHGFTPVKVFNLVENKPWFARMSRIAARMNLGKQSGIFTESVLFVLQRVDQ